MLEVGCSFCRAEPGAGSESEPSYLHLRRWDPAVGHGGFYLSDKSHL